MKTAQKCPFEKIGMKKKGGRGKADCEASDYGAAISGEAPDEKINRKLGKSALIVLACTYVLTWGS